MKTPRTLPLIPIALGCIGLGLKLWLDMPTGDVSDYLNEIRIVGISLTTIGGLLSIGIIAILVLRLTAKGTEKVVEVSSNLFIPDLDERYAKDADVKEVCRLGRESIGDNHPDYANMKLRLVKNGKIIKCVVKKVAVNTSIVGYYTLYPINSRVREKILNESLSSGKKIRVGEINKSFRSCTAIYISMIFGTSLPSKAYVLWALKRDLNVMKQTNPYLRILFAKPSTKEGLRLLTKYDFKPIGDDKGIWAFTFDK